MRAHSVTLALFFLASLFATSHAVSTGPEAITYPIGVKPLSKIVTENGRIQPNKMAWHFQEEGPLDRNGFREQKFEDVTGRYELVKKEEKSGEVYYDIYQKQKKKPYPEVAHGVATSSTRSPSWTYVGDMTGIMSGLDQRILKRALVRD